MIESIRKQLRKSASKERAKKLQRFFKTGPGEYGEGDIFLGVKVPDIRRIVKQNKEISREETLVLLKSPIHEERLLALLVLVLKYKVSDSADKETIYKLYIGHTRFINNWDLVDLTAPHIVGGYLEKRNKEPLFELAGSDDLWDRRIAVLATFAFIRNNKFNEALRISELLLSDKEDLIHKAVGWMLREIGKRDLQKEEEFLKKHYRTMPRTMLRYAIERFPETKRQKFLKKT